MYSPAYPNADRGHLQPVTCRGPGVIFHRRLLSNAKPRFTGTFPTCQTSGSRGSKEELLLHAKNRILSGLADTKLHHGLGRNPDLLLRFWIQAHTRFSLLFH